MAQMMNPGLMNRMKFNGGSPQLPPQPPQQMAQAPLQPGFQPQQTGMPSPPQQFGNYIDPILQQALSQNMSGANGMQQPQMNPLMQMLGYPTPGPIPTRKTGGPIPSATSALSALQQLMNLERDEVPIIAHEGEHVMTKEATEMVGQKNLDLLNQMAREMPRFKEGGGVSNWEFFERQVTTPNRSGPTSNNDKEYYDRQRKARGESEQPSDTTEGTSDRMSRTPRETTTTTTTSTDNKKYYERQKQPPPDLTEGRTIEQAPMMDPKSDSIAGVDLGGYADRQGALTLMEIGRQVVEGLTGPKRHSPEEFNYLQWPSIPPTPDAISSAQPAKDTYTSRPIGGDGQPTSGITQSQQKAVRPPQGQAQQQQQQETVPIQPPTPPVNPPKKDELTGGGEDNGRTIGKKEDISMERPYYRSPGAAPNIDWVKVSQLEPAQAYTYLQQYAGAQGKPGILNRSASGEDPRRTMFNDLASHYANLKGIEDKVNEQKWRDMLMKGESEKIKYELDRLKQISPYHADLTKAKLNLTNAQAYASLANLLTSQEQTGHLLDMSPDELLKMRKTSEEIRDLFIDRISDTKNSAYNVAKTQEDSTEAWKTYHEADIMHRMVTGTMPSEISWEDAKKVLGEKRSSFGRDKNSAAAVLDKQSFESARKSANRMLAQMQVINNPTETESVNTQAPGGGIDMNQFALGVQNLSQLLYDR